MIKQVLLEKQRNGGFVKIVFFSENEYSYMHVYKGI